MKKYFRKIFYLFLSFLFLLFIIPQNLVMPVQGAGESSYHPQSFWYYPWGKSGTHKGVDIFAVEGTSVNSATFGIVLYTGYLSRGGNVVCVLGPRLRIHYYAHLKEIKVKSFSFLDQGSLVGTVGTTGNAQGKPPHLHYSIVTMIPYPWLVDQTPQGWKKMFYLNPISYLQEK